MDPAISFILCSRNDSYMGNPVGRLEIALNYLGENVRALGREKDVEVVVTDWGSKTPLRDALKLTPTASRITSFIEVSESTMKEVQGDSPFAEVLALNAAARRTKGQYIGRIDQDTLVGKRFLSTFFDWIEGRQKPEVDLENSFLFSCRREVPFSFTKSNPSLEQTISLIDKCHSMFTVELYAPFISSPVGVMLLNRKIWELSGGYDEKLLYWGWMEVDLMHRVKDKYPLVDMGRLVGNDFYHLEHYHPSQGRRTPRKKNPEISEGLSLFPNKSNWGLIDYPLPVRNHLESAAEAPVGSRKGAAGVGRPMIVPITALKVMGIYTHRSILRLWERANNGIRQPARYGEYLLRMVGLKRGPAA